MRFLKKYKNYSKLTAFFKKFPITRIEKFNRPKWKKLQVFLKTKTITQQKFFNNLVLKVHYKHWDKLKSTYKDGLQTKAAVCALFDNAVSTKFFKKEFCTALKPLNKNLITSSLFKLLYRVDILLWKLNFFKSAFAAQQEINNLNILINNKPIQSNFFVSKGDIITFKKILPQIFLSTQIEFLYSFIEVDYYSNTIVIIKDLTHLSPEDNNLIIRENISIKKFVDYIKTK